MNKIDLSNGQITVSTDVPSLLEIFQAAQLDPHAPDSSETFWMLLQNLDVEYTPEPKTEDAYELDI